MGVTTYTRAAKCKDCISLKPEYYGKRKTHRCVNVMSKCYDFRRTLNDLVCEVWELK